MDMRKYVGSLFLKLEDVKEGPILATIADVTEGKYGKPDVSFEDGSKLSLNATNCRALAKAYGPESEFWAGKRIELSLGEVEFKGQPQETIIVRPVSPPIEHNVVPLKSELDDDIPSEGGESLKDRKVL